MGHKNLTNLRLTAGWFIEPLGHEYWIFPPSLQQHSRHLLCKVATKIGKEIVYQLTKASHMDNKAMYFKKYYHITCQKLSRTKHPTNMYVHKSCMIIEKCFMIFLSLWATITLAQPDPALLKTDFYTWIIIITICNKFCCWEWEVGLQVLHMLWTGSGEREKKIVKMHLFFHSYFQY